jgi:hypothetical protein
MHQDQEVDFILRDKVEGVEITPSTIDFSRFNEFNRQVEEFIAGSEKLSMKGVRVQVDEGSYKLKVLLPVVVMSAIAPDLRSLTHQDSLGDIDPKRADIVQRWQARAKKKESLTYIVRPPGFEHPIQFSRETDYRRGSVSPWITVEKYLFGTIEDMGGSGKANVHIRLQGQKDTVTVDTTQGYLRDQVENRLYHKVLARVEAEQHYKTGVLRNYRLISFEDYKPTYDEAALDSFAEAGRVAWADVPDAAAWVREIRGGTL